MGFIPLRPTVVNGAAVPAQNLAVTSSGFSFFTSAFSTSTSIVALQVIGGDCYTTFDNTGPSLVNGGQVFNGQDYYWDRSTAARAKFSAVSSNAVIYAQECANALDATTLPDMAIFKPRPITITIASSGSTSSGGISGATTGQVIVATGATTGTGYPGFTADASGNLTANHFQTYQVPGVPSVSLGAGAGSGATSTIVAGSTDTAGALNITTGSTGATANAVVFTLTYVNSFPATSFCVVTASNAPTGVIPDIYSTATKGQFTVVIANTTLPSSNTFKFSWMVMGL